MALTSGIVVATVAVDEAETFRSICTSRRRLRTDKPTNMEKRGSGGNARWPRHPTAVTAALVRAVASSELGRRDKEAEEDFLEVDACRSTWGSTWVCSEL